MTKTLPKAPGIYQIRCLPTDALYVGSAQSLHRRRLEHFKKLRGNRHPNIHLQRTFLRYGAEALAFEVLECCEKGLLLEREQYYMHTLKPTLNICLVAGSSQGRVHTPSARIKMSMNRRRLTGALNHFYGKTHSEETRLLIQQKALGRLVSPVSRVKAVQTLHERYGGHPSWKRVEQLDASTGAILATYPSLREAAKATGARINRISMVCSQLPVLKKGVTYYAKTAGGYGWRFGENP
jgi:group I intron endonuclease